MKKPIILFLLPILLFSCSVNSELSDTEIEGKWQLVRIIPSMIPNPPVHKPSYEEYYILKSNGRFTKVRITENDEMAASGTYNLSEEEPFEDREPGQILRFTYDSENDLIGSCGATPTEHLVFRNDNILINNSWIACDGPTLEYEKVK